MTILFSSDSEPPDAWRHACKTAFPDLAFRIWPDCGPTEAIRYAIVWRPPSGSLRNLPNLRAILVLGAGVDSVLEAGDMPAGVPVVRLLGAGMQGPMAEYALYAVLHFQRRMGDYFAQQSVANWQPRKEPLARDWPVGVMGLGVMGAHVAKSIAALNYPVAGWSASSKSFEGIETFAGRAQLIAFLARTRVLINVLPLTPLTRGILDGPLFAALPRGSYVVNIGRGGHVVESDLISALDSGQLAGAMLDVFEEEPLPASHAFWRHPKIIVTPHVAAPTLIAECAAQVIDSISRLERGEQPAGLVDRSKGY